MQQLTILEADEMSLVLNELASQILLRHGRCERLVLVGVLRRGVDLAVRLRSIFTERLGRDLPLGSLDINLYRDDWTRLAAAPVIGVTSIDFSLDEMDVLLVDDVLFSGRTVRAALEGLLAYGRPSRVELLVLVDRGHHELPIAADYVGAELETHKDDMINVFLTERDGRDAVCIEHASEQ